MRPTPPVLFAAILCLAAAAAAQPIIVDHTCIRYDSIPAQWVTQAKTTLRVGYGHTSHGSQLITGADALKSFFGAGSTWDYPYAYWGLNAGVFMNDYWGNAWGGADLGSSGDLTWRDATVAGLSAAGNDRNVVIWSWCGGMSGNTPAGINAYLNAMATLEQQYPGVKFVYMTGHLDGGGTAGNLNVGNNQIRAYCQANNKILFDFADIESYDPGAATDFLALFALDSCEYDNDGDGMPWGDGNWATEWVAANPALQRSQIAAVCGDCAHSQKLNCVGKGAAFWWLMARLAGWPGPDPVSHEHPAAVDGTQYTPGSSNVNGVLEPGETVVAAPSWHNGGAAGIAVTGAASSFSGGATTSYTVPDGVASYGTIAAGGSATCVTTGNCYGLAVGTPATRPVHWDASFLETLSQGSATTWTVHVGGSFPDVPVSYAHYKAVETVLHSGVTGGYADGTYRPSGTVARSQMAMLIARAMTGGDSFVPATGTVAGRGDYDCSSGGASLYSDVQPTDAFCRQVHLVAARGVTLGCGASTFCPASVVSRAQMAMLLARAVAGSDAAVPASYTDPGSGRSYACTTTGSSVYFADVPAGASYCRHVHYLWATVVADGCATSPARYCPADVMARGGMAKLLVNSFKLQMY